MIRTTLVAAFAMLPIWSVQADVITRTPGQPSGEIRDTGGNLLGTWSFAVTAAHNGFAVNPIFSNGSGSNNGAQLSFGSASKSGGDDVLSVRLQITPESGFVLDEVVIRQSTFNSDGTTHNGPGSARDDKGTETIPVGQMWAIEDYTGAFTANQGSGAGTAGDQPQITAPGEFFGDLAWQQVDDTINNQDDNWSVTLTDVGSGFDHVIRTSSPFELSREWLSFDTQFSTAPAAVPEPGTWAGGLIALGVMAVRRRRRSTDTLPDQSV